MRAYVCVCLNGAYYLFSTDLTDRIKIRKNNFSWF